MPRPAARLLLAIAVLGVAAATLTPASGTGAAARTSFWALGGGETATADLLRNVLLFAPVGLAWALAGGRTGSALLLGAGLSAAVEAAQLLIPGRAPMLADVVANALGSAAGAGLVHVGAAVRRPGRWSGGRRSALAFAAGACGGLVLLSPAWLAGPRLPATMYFGAWNPDMAHLARHPARVTDVRLAGRPLGQGPLEDSTGVRAALLRGDPLRIRLDAPRPGPPGALAALVTVHDERRREILLVGGTGADGLVRIRSRASALRLEPLAWRLPGALQGGGVRELGAGASAHAMLEVRRRSLHVEARLVGGPGAPARFWRVGLRPEDGWHAVGGGLTAPAGARRAAALLWVLAACLPAAVLAPWSGPGAAAAALPAAALLGAPAAGLDAAGGGALVAAIVPAAVVGVGSALRRRARGIRGAGTEGAGRAPAGGSPPHASAEIRRSPMNPGGGDAPRG